MSILINVDNQKMSSTMDGFVAGSQRFVKFQFNLTDEWDGLTTFAQFGQNGKAYNQYLDEDNCVFLPPEIGVGTCTLMLYGSHETTIGTTNYLTLRIDENILISDTSSTEISESLYNQLVTKINKEVDELNSKVTQLGNSEFIASLIEESVEKEMEEYLASGALGNLIDKPVYIIEWLNMDTATEEEKQENKEILQTINSLEVGAYHLYLNVSGTYLSLLEKRNNVYIFCDIYSYLLQTYEVNLISNTYTQASYYKATNTLDPYDFDKIPTSSAVADYMDDELSEKKIQEAVEEYLNDNPIEVNETDPTVPAWAKEATKPTYTAAEVGAIPTYEKNYLVNQTTAASAELLPNTYYKWGEMATLTLTLGAEVNGIVNEYCGEFVSGATATVLTVPESIKWVNGITVEAGKTYQFSIVNGIGVICGA